MALSRQHFCHVKATMRFLFIVADVDVVLQYKCVQYCPGCGKNRLPLLYFHSHNILRIMLGIKFMEYYGCVYVFVPSLSGIQIAAFLR
jgi:hypothetical protein